jgi:hypothetical protein
MVDASDRVDEPALQLVKRHCGASLSLQSSRQISEDSKAKSTMSAMGMPERRPAFIEQNGKDSGRGHIGEAFAVEQTEQHILLCSARSPYQTR